MNRMCLQPILAPLAGAVICFLAGPWTGAAGRAPLTAQLTGRAISVAGDEDTGRVGIYIERWSTDEELESVRAALSHGDGAVKPGQTYAPFRQQTSARHRRG